MDIASFKLKMSVSDMEVLCTIEKGFIAGTIRHLQTLMVLLRDDSPSYLLAPAFRITIVFVHIL